MSTRGTFRHSRADRGFTLVELMVTVSIALFLVGGLLTILQNVRATYNQQQQLVQLQDEQRFALTVITDAVQAAGYFPDPTNYDVNNFTITPPFNIGTGQVFAGSHTVGAADNVAQDTFSTRFWTNTGYVNSGYGPVLCNGVDTAQQPAGLTKWTVTFSVGPDPATGNSALLCSVNGGAAFALVDNVTALAVYYGVKRDIALADYNVDTYETWDIVGGGTDWQNISSVRIVITFLNPLFGQTTTQPQFITLERVIEVMSRGGPYT
jgi:type IV pilus assembly protein PilW